MNNRELRIGNYCKGVRIGLIKSIFITHFTVEDEQGIQLGNSIQDYFNPIPLTEEWLVKFGFSDITELCAVKTKNTKQFCKSYFVGKCTEQQTLFITLGSRGWSFKRVGAPIYNSVHQLQNLYFALTNEELIYEQ